MKCKTYKFCIGMFSSLLAHLNLNIYDEDFHSIAALTPNWIRVKYISFIDDAINLCGKINIRSRIYNLKTQTQFQCKFTPFNVTGVKTCEIDFKTLI